jgi:hypothetical protein
VVYLKVNLPKNNPLRLNLSNSFYFPKKLFEKCQFPVRSPLAPLLKGGNLGKVPLIKGDLGGSKTFQTGSQSNFHL